MTSAFSFLGWTGLMGGIWFLFDKSESVASASTKAEVARWLRGVSVASGEITWPSTFAQIFDRVFGFRHLSLGCFVRSCIASIATVAIMVFIWATRDPTRFRSFASNPGGSPVVLVLMLTAVMNLPFDYISLLKTRYVIKWMAAETSIRRLYLGLIFDFFATFAIAIVPIFLLLCAAMFTLGFSHPEISPVEELFVRVLLVTGRALLLTVYVEGDPTFGIWLYATFFTSVWVWLYAFSGIAARWLSRIPLKRFVALFDLDAKPITSLGWVAMAVASIVYWGLAYLER